MSNDDYLQPMTHYEQRLLTEAVSRESSFDIRRSLKRKGITVAFPERRYEVVSLNNGGMSVVDKRTGDHVSVFHGEDADYRAERDADDRDWGMRHVE